MGLVRSVGWGGVECVCVGAMAFAGHRACLMEPGSAGQIITKAKQTVDVCVDSLPPDALASLQSGKVTMTKMSSIWTNERGHLEN